MSENVQADRRTASDTDGGGTLSWQQDSGEGGLHRVDPLHPEPVPHGVSTQIPAPPEPTQTAASGDQAPGPSTLPPRPSVGDEQQLLLQASQLADHLRTQFTELNRREQSLNAQLTLLDQERRNIRLWGRHVEEELQEREAKLRVGEVEFAEKASACEEFHAELQEQERGLVRAREELIGERARLKGDLDKELEEDRVTLKEDRRQVERERHQLREQTERNQQEHDAALTRMQQQLEEERKVLRQTLTEERMTEDLRRDRASLERECAEFETRRDAVISELAEERELQERSLSQVRAEFETLHRTQLEEFEQQKAEQEQRLQQERQEFEQERDEQQKALQQDRSTLDNRLRFQQEHLTKTRQELEESQCEFRREAQQRQQQVEDAETRSRQRARQLEHYRTLLEERELSVSRERELLSKARRTSEGSLDGEKRRLQAERQSWERERDAQRAEVRRQQDMLALHAENLEARRTRLDQLRSELENTHRETLETRMAIEEAWAQLAQGVGEDQAKQRVEAVRHALSEHYRQLRDGLFQQRRELEEAQMLAQRQKDEFRDERQTLTDWLAKRDEDIRQREESLRHDSQNLDKQEAAWRSLRDRWMQEKIEAETIIRDLLVQLTDAGAETANAEGQDTESPAHRTPHELLDGEPAEPTEITGPPDSFSHP